MTRRFAANALRASSQARQRSTENIPGSAMLTHCFAGLATRTNDAGSLTTFWSLALPKKFSPLRQKSSNSPTGILMETCAFSDMVEASPPHDHKTF